jgi:hypothetical protein
MIQKKLFVLAFALLFVLSCKFLTATQAPPSEAPLAAVNTPVPTNTATPAAPVDTPTASPIPQTPTSEVQQFFTEKFQNNYDKNWSYFLRRGQDADFSLSVESDGLLFDLQGKGIFSYLYYKPFDYEEVRVEAVVENRGVNDNNVTLFCRYSPTGGWYEFNVYSSGLYDMFFTKPDSAGNLNYGKIAEGGSNRIKTGRAVNTYAIVCKRDSLSLFINGDGVKTVGLPNYVPKGGKIGISVSSFTLVPVQVLVQQVTISQP